MPIIIGRAANVMTYLVRFIEQQDVEGCNGNLLLAVDMPENDSEGVAILPIGSVENLSPEQREKLDGADISIPEEYKDKNIFTVIEQPRETFYSKGRPDIEGKEKGYDRVGGREPKPMEYHVSGLTVPDTQRATPSKDFRKEFHKEFFAKYAKGSEKTM